MKRKVIALICFLLIFVMVASSCDSNEIETEATNGTEGTGDIKTTQADSCADGKHDYVEVSRTDALALKDGEIKYQCSRCKAERVEKIAATKSLKILALGNSFTDDSTWHLWNM